AARLSAESPPPASPAAAREAGPGTGGPFWSDPDDPRGAFAAVRAEVAKAVVGQDPVVTGLLIALLCQGHVLLEGVPGVAKTLLVRALAASLRLQSKRGQFTPALMPRDVTGPPIYRPGAGRV